MARLGEIGQIITGNTPKTSEIENYSSNDICFVKPSDILENDITYINDSEFYISEVARDKARILPPQSILVTCIGIIGKVAINQIECAFNQQINAIIPDLKKCMPNYLAYAIQHKKNEIQDIANAAVVPILNKTQFSGVEINLPKLDEQCKIVTVLDKLSDLISLRKQQLAKLDELVRARFVEMFGDPVINPFGWEQATLKDVAIGKLTYGSGASSCVYDGNIRYIRITDIDDNGKLNDDIVSPSVVEEKYLLNDGDILFARSGATVGKTYRYHKSDGKCLYAGYLIRLIPDQSQVLPDYIFYFTKTSYYENFVASNMKVVAQPNINAQQYGDLIICVPPLGKQQDFVVAVQKINRQKLTIQKSLDKLEVLKKSLMQEYFGRGDLSQCLRK